MSKHNEGTDASIRLYHGIDYRIIEAATRKARRERSEAVWAMLQSLFGRRAGGNKANEAHGDVTSIACAGVH